jgi:hypothetical protein
MSSLILCSYKQPANGESRIRWGVLDATRDTKKEPLSLKTIKGSYRKDDPIFQRSRNIETLQTRDGFRCLYKERQNWRIRIPLVGSVVKKFL